LIGFVVGIFVAGSNLLNLPGLPRFNLPEPDIPGVDISIEPESDASSENADTVSEFHFVLRDDQIYYNDEPIDEDRFRTLIAEAKEQDAIIEIEYDEATVTGSFVDELQEILRAEGVQYTGIDR
jgi:biopolymer transport protein ExbD